MFKQNMSCEIGGEVKNVELEKFDLPRNPVAIRDIYDNSVQC
jgi:hypothetical protein